MDSRELVSYTYADNSYDEYSPGCGVGKDIDIHDYFTWDDITRYYIYKHSGTLSTEITRYFYGVQDEASAIGRYYHHTILINGSLSFSTSPSISLYYEWNYSKSSDTGCIIKFYK